MQPEDFKVLIGMILIPICIFKVCDLFQNLRFLKDDFKSLEKKYENLEDEIRIIKYRNKD